MKFSSLAAKPESWTSLYMFYIHKFNSARRIICPKDLKANTVKRLNKWEGASDYKLNQNQSLCSLRVQDMFKFKHITCKNSALKCLKNTESVVLHVVELCTFHFPKCVLEVTLCFIQSWGRKSENETKHNVNKTLKHLVNRSEDLWALLSSPNVSGSEQNLMWLILASFSSWFCSYSPSPSCSGSASPVLIVLTADRQI